MELCEDSDTPNRWDVRILRSSEALDYIPVVKKEKLFLMIAMGVAELPGYITGSETCVRTKRVVREHVWR